MSRWCCNLGDVDGVIGRSTTRIRARTSRARSFDASPRGFCRARGFERVAFAGVARAASSAGARDWVKANNGNRLDARTFARGRGRAPPRSRLESVERETSVGLRTRGRVGATRRASRRARLRVYARRPGAGKREAIGRGARKLRQPPFLTERHTTFSDASALYAVAVSLSRDLPRFFPRISDERARARKTARFSSREPSVSS